MLKVILVRHGETEWNKLKQIQGGSSDTKLNKNGKRQAESVALKLATEKIQAIYSSPLQRALNTARTIARHHQLKVTIEPSLREIDAGELEGVAVDEIGSRLDQILTGEGDSFFRMPGGESLAEVQQRTWPTIQRLVSQHPDGVVVVVSHYFAILTIICSVLNLPLSQIGRLRLTPGSISAITFEEQRQRLILFNDSCHLNSI